MFFLSGGVGEMVEKAKDALRLATNHHAEHFVVGGGALGEVLGAHWLAIIFYACVAFVCFVALFWEN
jgi:hypothetical protein